jgi:hypothetical protein
MEKNGSSRCNSDDEACSTTPTWGGEIYALINVKQSNVIPEYLIMCIKVGECTYYFGPFITEFQYLHPYANANT